MTFGWGADKEESRQLFETYRDAGGNFIVFTVPRPASPSAAPSQRPTRNRIGFQASSLFGGTPSVARAIGAQNGVNPDFETVFGGHASEHLLCSFKNRALSVSQK
jgi:hypothetical protein